MQMRNFIAVAEFLQEMGISLNIFVSEGQHIGEYDTQGNELANETVRVCSPSLKIGSSQ